VQRPAELSWLWAEAQKHELADYFNLRPRIVRNRVIDLADRVLVFAMVLCEVAFCLIGIFEVETLKSLFVLGRLGDSDSIKQVVGTVHVGNVELENKRRFKIGIREGNIDDRFVGFGKWSLAADMDDAKVGLVVTFLDVSLTVEEVDQAVDFGITAENHGTLLSLGFYHTLEQIEWTHVVQIVRTHDQAAGSISETSLGGFDR
jgi:hypothetical protein